ncbi:alpha/beta hydrolase [uncultured Mycolicibacterium sp.]|uniref:alpha/beta hydrolase n=2 Tax=Mycolicibacterium TaxID=1866885 RepID=UPI0032B1B879
MVDRYRVWLGAGFLAGGMSAAMLTGAGVATADDGASAGSESQPASGTKDSGESDQDASGPGKAASSTGADKPGKHRKDDDDADAVSVPDGDDDVSVDDGDGSDVSDGSDGSEVSDLGDVEDQDDEDADDLEQEITDDGDGEVGEDSPGEDVEASPPQPSPSGESEDPADDSADAAESPDDETAEPDIAEPSAAVPDTAAGDLPVEQADAPDAAPPAAEPSSFVTSVETDLGATDAAVVMRAAAVQAPWLQAVQGVAEMLDDIGTAVYNFYTGAMQFLAGPVRAPLGSNVRVESSTLQIGDVEVPADWYFPDTDKPAGIIYLQHGFMATASFYSATAAYLAEKTLSIVVAPTLTWNIFDIDGYPLMLSRTHRAVADLFTGDRAALNASAQAAGYHKTLPSRLVLAGHSAGGGLAVGVAGYLADRDATGDLAGVVMLDGVGFGDHLSSDLAKIPRDIPVYNLAGEPYGWNDFGGASTDLAEARPGEFTGVLVNGGLHADAMQSSSPMIQFASYLATGFSKPWNVAAGEMLSAGWISDMLYGTHTARLYGAPGSMLNIFTGWWMPSVAQVYPVVHQYVGPLDVLFTCLLNPGTVQCTYVTPGYTRRASKATSRVA